MSQVDGREPIQNSRELRPSGEGDAPVSRVLETCAAPAAPPPAPAGQEFVGREMAGYRLEEFVGAGGFSLVFRAKRASDGAEFALKLPRVAGFVDHLRHEALVSARFQDPNVVPIVEVRLDHEPPFLVMPFIRGENLALPGQPPSTWTQVEVFRRFRDVVAVVARLHAAEIAHGDLKPGNIRFERAGPPVRPLEKARWDDAFEWPCHLLDLGLARHQVAARQLSTLRASVISVTGENIAGTFAFMAPEVMSGAPPSKRSDVYALGVILHHMLCGRPPAFGVSADDLNPYLPPGAVAFLREALQAEPEKRFPDAGAMLPDLDRFIAAEKRCLGRRNGHERRLVFVERMRTLERGLRVLAGTAGVASLAGLVYALATMRPAGPRAGGPELTPLETIAVLGIPLGVVAGFVCMLLAMTTINAWILGVPERLYKNRKGHAIWSFMMQ